ncbi:MAG: hypothetical protein ACE5FA_12655, partial [Dehalococcoidia bacterium]
MELLDVCATIRQLDDQRTRARNLHRIVSERRADALSVQAHPLGRDIWNEGDQSWRAGERAFADGDFSVAFSAWTSAQGSFDRLWKLKQKVDAASLAQRRFDNELSETNAELVKKYAPQGWVEVLDAVSRARAAKTDPHKIKKLHEAALMRLQATITQSVTAAQAALEVDLENINTKLLASYSETVWPRAVSERDLCQEASDARNKLPHCDHARALVKEATVEALGSVRQMFIDEYTPAAIELITNYAGELLADRSAEFKQVQSCDGTAMECVVAYDRARSLLGTVMSEVATRAENQTECTVVAAPVDLLKEYAVQGWANVASLLESARQPDATSFNRARLNDEALGLLTSAVPIEAEKEAKRRFEGLLADTDAGLVRKYADDAWTRVLAAQSRAQAVDIAPIERAQRHDDGSTLIVEALVAANTAAETTFRNRLSSMDSDLMRSYASKPWKAMISEQKQAEGATKDSMAQLGHLDRGLGIL